MEWDNIQRVGFSVRNMDEAERAVRLGANLIEVKVEKFASSGIAPYFFERGIFHEHNTVLEMMSDFSHDHHVTIQWHLPVEGIPDHTEESGFNAGIILHHQLIIDRFSLLEYIYRTYDIGSVSTMHPVTISVGGREFMSEKEAIKNSKILFDRLDAIRVNERHKTLIGIENQTDLKQKAGTLGFLPSHFKRILQDTRTIGITIDTGHRRLTQNFSIGNFLSLGFTVNNFHFHGNDGVFNPIDWRDDHHVLPTVDNVSAHKNAYGNFLRYFRRHRPPIVLEISHLEKYSDDELRNFLVQFKQELA